MSGETRKLQKVGGGTYTVSIPKEWATEQSLSAGETVHLYPDGDGSLVVCRDGDRTDPVSATIPPHDDDQETLDRTLRAAYAAGVEHLTLTAADGFDDAARRRLKTLARERTGMRIVEEAETTVTIHTVLDDGEVSVQRSVVQLQFVTLSLFRTAVDLALDPDATGQDRIDERRADARRLTALVTRQFGRSLSRPGTTVDLGVSRPVAFDCYRTARALDRLAALSTTIAGCAADPPAEAAVDPIRDVAEAVRLYAEAAATTVVDGPSLAAVRDLQGTRSTLTERLADAEIAVDADPSTTPILLAFADAADAGERIAAVAFEAAVREDA